MKNLNSPKNFELGFHWLNVALSNIKKIKNNLKTDIKEADEDYASIQFRNSLFVEDEIYQYYLLNTAVKVQKYLNNSRSLIFDNEETNKIAHEVIFSSEKFFDREDVRESFEQIIELFIKDKRLLKNAKFKKDLAKQIFCAQMLSVYEIIVLGSEKNRLGNYFEFSKAITTMFSDIILTFLLERNLIDLDTSDPYYLMLDTNDELKQRFVDIMIENLVDIGLLKINYTNDPTTIGKESGVRTMKVLSLTDFGTEIFSTISKTELYYYKKLPMFMYPYNLILEEPNTILGDGFSIAKYKLDAITDPVTGCSIEFISPDLVDTINIMSNIPYNLNFNLFQQYLQKFGEEGDGNNVGFLNFSSSCKESIFPYLPKPLEKPEHKVSLKMFNNKMIFILYITIVIFELSFAHIEHEEKDIGPVWELVKEQPKKLMNFLTKHNRVFFSLFLDMRGRSYHRSQLLLFGSSFMRAFLLCPTSVEIDLKISKDKQKISRDVEVLGNCLVSLYGSDPQGRSVKTLSWNEKTKLFIENLNFYLSFAQIATAKKQYLYTSMLYELHNQHIKIEDDCLNQKIQSKILIHLDNSNSSSQIYSTLLGIAYTPVNLRSQDQDSKIEDLYTDIGINFSNRISHYYNYLNKEKFSPVIKYIDEISKYQKKWTRDFFKKILMPYLYGLKPVSILKLFEKSFQNLIDENKEDSKNLTNLLLEKEQNKEHFDLFNLLKTFLYEQMIAALDDTIPELINLYKSLRKYATNVSRFDQPISYASITGDLKIKQRYCIMKKVSYPLLKSKGKKQRKRITLPVVDETANDIAKNADSFAANYIQSIDGALSRAVVSSLNKEYKDKHILFGLIHDNYLIQITNYDLFLSHYKKIYVQVFSEENIQNLAKSMSTPNQIIKNYLKQKDRTTLTKKEKAKKRDLEEAYNTLMDFFTNKKYISRREEFRKNVLLSKYILTF